MRNVNICLIALASLLFLLINFYGLLEILRYFKLKQQKDLKERIRENRVRGESNWHTIYTSTSLYEINTKIDESTKKYRPDIEFLAKTTKKPPVTFFQTTVIPSQIPTTTRIHVTTKKDELPKVVSTIPTSTIIPTIVVTTSKSVTTPTRTISSTPRIVVTTKPDWFQDNHQLEEQRRRNAERRRQQLVQMEMKRRIEEENIAKKRLEQELEEKKNKEKDERERIHKLGEERRRKEHAEIVEARRIQAIEEARTQMLLEQERERMEARRRSEEEKERLLQKQQEELAKLRLHEEEELRKKKRLEAEQRRLVEQQHREREKLREELHQIELLRRQQAEIIKDEKHLLQEEEDEEGKTVEMSLEEDDEEYSSDRDESSRVTITTTPQPFNNNNNRTFTGTSERPQHVTTTTSSNISVETPEPPRNEEVTIVTAFLDIGRGDWFHYQRPLEKYHEFMENLLSLQNNMVIFTDKSSYDFVHKYRKNLGLMAITKIHMIQFDDLPLSRHLPYAQKIIEDEMNNKELYLDDPDMKNHPEAKSAEYDIVVNSKTYFLYNTTIEDPFETDFFVWIDAGYGHGNQNVYPYNNVWKPTFPRNKISMIKLTPEHDPIKKYKIENLYRRNWSVMSGGFIAGDKRSIGQLYTVTHNKFVHLIYQNKVDDDQTVMVLAINSYPHLFDIKQGDWFDAFRLYSDSETLFGAKTN